MGKDTNIQAPPTPDYGASYAQGVQADVDSLPLRNAINAASQLGTIYTDPNTGRTYDFTGLGSSDVAHAQLMQQIADAPDTAKALLDLQRQYGTDFVTESRRQAEAYDPTGFRLRETLGNRLNAADSAGNYEDILPPEFASLVGTEYSDDPQTSSARKMLQSQLMDKVSQAGTLDPALQRAAEQAARARGASTGNLFGGGAALREALGVQLAQRASDESARSNLLQFLSSGQSTSDTANRMREANFGNQQAVAGFNNQAAQNSFANQLNLAGAKTASNQQDVANMQSYLGLAPVAQQAGYNTNAQGGAAPFMSGTGYQAQGTSANAGQAGANFALGSYGTQAQIYNTQLQNSSNPFAAILGQGLGSFAGTAGKMGAAALFCHVARLVYGEDNPRWFAFYVWKEAKAPAWFRRLYNRFTKPVAAIIRPFPLIQSLIRGQMDKVAIA